MGYSEFYCHLCGVSFNIIFRLKSGELDVPDSNHQDTPNQCDETDGYDSTDDKDTGQDLDYQSQKSEDDEPYEYDSDYESTDDMSLRGGNDDIEDSSTDVHDLENQIYYNWVLQTFDPWRATNGNLPGRVGYFDSAMSGYSADAISPAEAKGCRTAQFLIHKPTPRDQWNPDELHEPWEIKGDWSLSGICDGTPSRDTGIPTVWPARNGVQDIEADNVNVSHRDDLAADDIAMPFHPWCFDIFCRQSKIEFRCVNVAGLMIWRNAEFDWDAFTSFPRDKGVTSSQEQWWSHKPGAEYMVANPLYVPGLSEILLSARNAEGLSFSSDTSYELKSSQPVTTRPTAFHNNQADFLTSLPAEIQLMIIDYLHSRDITSLSLASRAFNQLPNRVWYRIVRKEMPWLWEAWEESECIHNPSPWTVVTTADIKSMVTERGQYTQALIEDSYTELAAEKAAEYRFPVPMVVPDQVKLPRMSTDWHRVFMQIQLNWNELKGLRNRERIWVDVEEVVRRIRRFDP